MAYVAVCGVCERYRASLRLMKRISEPWSMLHGLPSMGRSALDHF